MKKSIRLIIVVAVVGLSIAAFFIVKNLPEKESDSVYTPPERYELIDSLESEIASMTFSREDGTTLVFEKKYEGEGDDAKPVWTLASPKVFFEPRERDIRDIAYSMSGVSSDQIIEEEPADLSVYGLDNPSATAIIAFTDGTSATLFAGAKTPTKVAYYVQLEGDPKVYAVRNYTINRFFTELDDMRDRDIPLPNPQAITYFKLTGEQVIEIVKMDEEDDFIGSQFASMKLVQPFKQERSIDTQRFSELIEILPGAVTIEEFVDDNPSDLSVYGLDPPKYEWIMRDEESFVHLLFGNDVGEDEIHVKLPDDIKVFTLAKSSLPIYDIKPFTLVDKFVLIPNIDIVDEFTINGFGKTFISEIKREKKLSVQEGEEDEVISTYFVDGTEIEEDPYKDFYQSVIGLLVDAVNPEPKPMGTPDVTIVYKLGEEAPVASARADFVKLSHDFYAVYLNGITEYLLSSYQIDTMFSKAEALLQ